jgi:hypothetical protein
MQTLTFKEFNALVPVSDYCIERDNLFLDAYVSGIQVEAIFYGDTLKGISFT